MKLSEIRKEARESLKGSWGKAASTTFVFLVISFIISFLKGFLEDYYTVYELLDLAYLVISIPLSFGLLITFMKLKRNEEFSVFGFFKDGFSRFGRAWGIWFRTLLKVILPSICLFITTYLLVIVIVLLLLGVAITYPDLTITQSVDSAVIEQLSSLTPELLKVIPILIILFVLSLIYMATKSLLYTFAYNIGYDNPELSCKECVLKSAELMKGKRIKYCLLILSFIGWGILAICTLGIGMLWLTPYMQVTSVCFYERLVKNKDENDENVINTKE